MSKLYPSILGVASFIWVAGWTWWLSVEQQTGKKERDMQVSAFSIVHDHFHFSSDSIFHFNNSESIPFVPAGNHRGFKLLAAYLLKNETLNLTLTGTYLEQEHNRTTFPNLGLARAEAIKAYLVQYEAPASRIKTDDLCLNSFEGSDKTIKGGVGFSISKVVPAREVTGGTIPADLAGAGSSMNRVFFYGENEYALNKAHLPYLDELREYLQANSSTKVVLTGYSEQAEERNTKLRLAEMRAKAVRRYLVDTGLRRSQIEVIAKPEMAGSGRERIVTISLK